MFSTLYGTYFTFEMHFKMSYAICFNLDRSKILSSGNGLTTPPPKKKKKKKYNYIAFDSLVGTGENTAFTAFSPIPTVFLLHGKGIHSYEEP